MADVFPFETIYSIKGVLLAPFLLIGLTSFLLGFYVLLFGLTVYFLCVRPAVVNRRLHLAWTTVLFVLSISASLCRAAETIKEAVLSFQVAVTQDFDILLSWVGGNTSQIIFQLVTLLLYIFANCVADAILLYRYFTLWDSSWRACIIPAIALAVTNVIGIVGSLLFYIPLILLPPNLGEVRQTGINFLAAYYFVNAGNSLLLSLIIGGRIWWMSRDSRKFLGHQISQKYNRVIAIVIESGAMYSASLIIHASIRQSLSTFGFPLDLSPLAYLMVGIAPTLIILRTSLGLSRSAVPDTQILSTLRFGEPPQTAAAAATGTVERSEVHTVDLEPEQESTNESGDIEAQKNEASSEATASKA